MAQVCDGWDATHFEDLCQKGVGLSDASMAVRLGWYIFRFHRRCFGTVLPIEYCLKPQGFYVDALASCSGGRFAGKRQYTVYPHKLWERTKEFATSRAADLEVTQILESFAFHEMRHRAQDLEQKSLIMFTPDSAPYVHDKTLALICEQVAAYFEDQRRILGAQQKSTEEIELRFGPLEYDATVAEWRYRHLIRSHGTEAALPLLVRDNGPIVPSR